MGNGYFPVVGARHNSVIPVSKTSMPRYVVTSFERHRLVYFFVIKSRPMTRRRHRLVAFPALNAPDKAVSINFDNRKKVVVVITAVAQFTINVVATQKSDTGS